MRSRYLLPLVFGATALLSTAVVSRTSTAKFIFETYKLRYECKTVLRSGVVEHALSRWPSSVQNAVPVIRLIPGSTSGAYLTQLPPTVHDVFSQARLLGGSLQFDSQGRIISLHVVYRDSSIDPAAIDHELAHYLWRHIQPEDHQRISLLLSRTTDLGTSNFVLDAYISPRLQGFLETQIDQETSLLEEVNRLTQEFIALSDSFSAQHDAILSSFEYAVAGRDVARASKIQRQLRSRQQTLLQLKVSFDQLTQLRRLVGSSIQSVHDMLTSVVASGRLPNFSEYSRSAIERMETVIQKLEEFKRQSAKLPVQFKPIAVDLDKLRSLKSELDDLYQNELFARAIAYLAVNPADPSYQPLRDVLVTIKLKHEPVFTHWLSAPVAQSTPLPPISCLP